MVEKLSVALNSCEPSVLQYQPSSNLTKVIKHCSGCYRGIVKCFMIGSEAYSTGENKSLVPNTSKNPVAEVVLGYNGESKTVSVLNCHVMTIK